MVVDLGVGIEGTVEDELPEALLCQTRYDRVDLDGGARLVVGAYQSSARSSTSAIAGAVAIASTADKSLARATTSAEFDSIPTVTTQSSSSKHRNQQKS